MVEVAADGPEHAVSDSDERKREIVSVVEGLVRDLHGAPVGAVVVTPTSGLDRDLGIDSIGRTELRVERLPHVKLPTKALTDAETVGDLLEAIKHAAARAAPVHTAVAPPPETPPPLSAPSQARALIEALEWQVARHPDLPYLVGRDMRGSCRF